MRCTQNYPVILTDKVDETAAYYETHFRFRRVFDANWYVHLQSTEDESVNLAILDKDHETIPAAGRGKRSGLIVNFEVADVDAVYADVQASGADIVKPLQDEPFGQRHFVAIDPSGVLIDVITPIEPSEEFLKSHGREAFGLE